MVDGDIKIRWEPRVPRHKVRQLYELYSRGIIDEELMDEVGYGLYCRCLNIIEVSKAVHRRVTCPGCGQIIVRSGGKEELLQCPECSWEILWRDYMKTYHKKRLYWGGAGPTFFRSFLEEWPSARTPHHKMRVIDTLIHQVHVQFDVGSRPVAVNLIGGKQKEVRALLDELAGEPIGDRSINPEGNKEQSGS